VTGAWTWPEEMTRRSFVRLLGAGAAMAGVGACFDRPRERILPYASRPPELTPGVPLHYATSMVLDGFGTGLLVESREGRPVKIEGNPDHPASLGAAGVFQQASLLQLYDPGRARAVFHRGKPARWPALRAALAPTRIESRAGARGAGLRVLLEPTSSPLMAELLDRFRERYPEAGVHFYAPLDGGGELRGTELLFGQPLQPVYDLRDADVIAAFDADLFGDGPFHLRYARDASARRRPSDAPSMSRLYVAETVPSATGTLADHRLAVSPSAIEPLLGGLLAAVARLGRRAPGMTESALERLAAGAPAEARPWILALTEDLVASGRRCVVAVGRRQSTRAHALGCLLNEALAGREGPVCYIRTPLAGYGRGVTDLQRLVEAMRAGAVRELIVLEGNPVYSAPADLEFAAAMGRVAETIALGLFRDETGALASWFAPALHYLEAWGDARAYDGTASLVQPLIAPLYGGAGPEDILAALLGETRSTYELLRAAWRAAAPAGEFESLWERSVQRGLFTDTAFPAIAPTLDASGAAAVLESDAPPPSAGEDGLELLFQPDPTVYDGRFANNPWLQELPDPLTKLTWDTAALLSPATAARLGLRAGDLADLDYRGRRLRLPVLPVPAHAEDVVSVRFGYGRQGNDEAVSRGVGASAYRLWTSHGYAGGALGMQPAGEGEVRRELAITQEHWSLEGRPLALQATLAHYREGPLLPGQERGPELSLFDPAPHAGDQWAMTVDLGVCTGCSACVVACQAENNIPVVGREGVRDGREMHWIRVDRYLSDDGSASGDRVAPGIISQPMLCQHCEQAPCEYVCPVNATVHSPDGLNEMVYNRCVGTRFCSNNCPYKVRRFNWFDYNEELAETERMARNPEVTVRARGVMEKCTFCVQRIRNAQITARIEDRPLRSGEVRTACQQACPMEAIAFGSLNDSSAEVVRRRAEPRSYAALQELGTRPRVTYLARITNPNPALAVAGAGRGSDDGR
jgi:Fe-S-cluster-containing dehydrogenase component